MVAIVANGQDWQRRTSWSCAVFIFAAWLVGTMSPALAQSPGGGAPRRCMMIEVYFREADAERAAVLAAAEELRGSRQGITVMLRPIDGQPRNEERWQAVLKHFKIAPQTSPVLYGCNRAIVGATPQNSWSAQLRELLRIEVFTRAGCPHCAAAKEWLPTLMREYPGLELVIHEIVSDAGARNRLSKLVEQHRTAAASVPVFHLCHSLIVGFDSPATTGPRLRAVLKPWSYECNTNAFRMQTPGNVRLVSWQADRDSSLDVPPELPLGPPIEGPEGFGKTQGAEDGLPTGQGNAEDEVELPVFGRLSATKLGMPLFTIAIGLVDGFNPCAMWVLLFLLSILVNLGDRRRILAIAGVFVVVSGLAYFAFMAAWLNVFVLVGYLRPIEIALGLLAIGMGTVHVKDFFAFKKGFSLSIPDSAKPGIYARVRRIVTAEHLTGAILGAITLAVLVNMVELLCTAGLPALYTSILTQHGYSPLTRYAYLGLYILAYMFDDILMLAVVVITLSKRKLQEAEGRWLKLVSGAAILLLGVIMLVRPEWLH